MAEQPTWSPGSSKEDILDLLAAMEHLHAELAGGRPDLRDVLDRVELLDGELRVRLGTKVLAVEQQQGSVSMVDRLRSGIDRLREQTWELARAAPAVRLHRNPTIDSDNGKSTVPVGGSS